MKKFKIVLSSLLVTTAIITLASFVAKDYNQRAFTTTCKYFIGPSSQKVVVGPGRNLSLTACQDPQNWVPAPNPPTDCDGGDYLCAVCFDNSLSLETVLDIVWDVYDYEGGLTHETEINPGGPSVVIYLQSTTAGH
jgi:hypothetical protein